MWRSAEDRAVSRVILNPGLFETGGTRQHLADCQQLSCGNALECGPKIVSWQPFAHVQKEILNLLAKLAEPKAHFPPKPV